MAISDSFIRSLILIVLVLFPYLVLYQQNLLEKQQQLKQHTCASHYKDEKQLCIACVYKNKLSISAYSQMILTAKGSQFLGVKFVDNGLLQCSQILQMVDSQNVDELTSAYDLKLQAIKPIKKIINSLQIKQEYSQQNKLTVDQQVKQIAIISIKNKGIAYTAKYVSYIPQTAQNFTRFYINMSSYFSLLACLWLLFYFVSQKKNKWYHLIIAVVIVIMVRFSAMETNLYTSTNLYLLKYSKILFLGLLFMKIGSKRLLVVAIMISFYLLNGTIYQVYAVAVYIVLIFYYLFTAKDQNIQNSDYLISQTCLIILIANLWVKQRQQFKFIALSIILQYNVLIFGTLLTVLKRRKIDRKYEKLPAQSGLYLPGFEQSSNSYDYQEQS